MQSTIVVRANGANCFRVSSRPTYTFSCHCAPPLSCAAQRSNPVNYVVAYATHIAFTGSSWSHCSPAMIKSTVPSSPLWRGAAQRRGGQRSQDSITTMAHRSPRSHCSPAMIKSPVPSSPLWRGAAQRRGGQRSQDSIATMSHRSPGSHCPPPS